MDAGRDLVHHQPFARGAARVGHDEELHGQHAHVVERAGDPGREPHRVGGRGEMHAGRHRRGVQDAVAVEVLARVVGPERAVEAARAHHRDFPAERHQALQDAGLAGQRRQVGQVGFPAHGGLPLAVVAEAARFQQRGPAQRCHGGREPVGVVHGREGRRFQAEVAQKTLFVQPVLCHRERPPVGPHRPDPFQDRHRAGRHVLELVGDHVDRGRETRQGRLVVVAPDRAGGRHREGGAVGLGRIDVDPQA